MGNQSFSDFSLELGEAGNVLYNQSAIGRAVMDHPYVAGAAIGTGGGLAGADASIGISGTYSVAKTWNDTLRTENHASVGGKVRLGGWPCKIVAKTHLAKAYEKFTSDKTVSERHRHPVPSRIYFAPLSAASFVCGIYQSL